MFEAYLQWSGNADYSREKELKVKAGAQILQVRRLVRILSFSDIPSANQTNWKQGEPEVDRAVPSQEGVGCCCDEVIYDPTTHIAPFYSRFPATGSWFCISKEEQKVLPKKFPVVCKEMVRNKKLPAGFCDS
jgi:hypothetical protein